MIESNQIQNDVDDVAASTGNTKGKVDHGTLEDISILAGEDKKESTLTVEVASDLIKEFLIFEGKKYNYDSELKNKNLQREINTLWKLGLDRLKQGYNTTTSSFNGKRIRSDEALKRAKIAYVLKNQENLYPNFKRAELEYIINGTLPNFDHRVKKKYLQIIEEYSTKDSINGTFNVEKYCDQIPQKYMDLAKEALEDG